MLNPIGAIRDEWFKLTWMRYALAVLATGLAALLRWALPGALAGTPYLAFYPAVVASAALGGLGPGLLATVGSALCVDVLFDSTPGWIDLGDPVVIGRLAIFLAGGVGTSLLAEMQRAAQARAVKQARELDRSNKDLEQFAYVASHDLQEPLRAVSGFVTLLQQRYQGKLDERADEWIAHVVEGAARMQSLIGDLLAYSRVGTQAGATQPTPAQSSLDTALRNLAASIEDAEAAVTAEPLPVVRCDPLQLVQLFQNLIGNAIKFRSDRRPEVHVGVRSERDAWLFWVRDNGIGIAPEYADRIFLIFQRLHTRTKYPGTGIGLAICKKIVERHGGRIWIESQPGEGATFYFTIPDKKESIGDRDVSGKAH